MMNKHKEFVTAVERLGDEVSAWVREYHTLLKDIEAVESAGTALGLKVTEIRKMIPKVKLVITMPDESAPEELPVPDDECALPLVGGGRPEVIQDGEVA